MHRLAPITRPIQAFQDPKEGAAVSRLWRTSIKYATPSGDVRTFADLGDVFSLSLPLWQHRAFHWADNKSEGSLIWAPFFYVLRI